MTLSPTTALKVWMCGLLAASVVSMYVMQLLIATTDRFPGPYPASVSKMKSRSRLLRALLGDQALAYVSTHLVLFPLFEILYASALLTSAYLHGVGPSFVRDALYLMFAFSAGVVCWQGTAGVYRIPDVITKPGILVGLLAAVATSPTPSRALLTNGGGAVAGYLAIRLICDGYYRATGKEGLGLGNAKLLAVVGAFYGWTALPGTLFVASLVGVAMAVPSVIMRRAGASVPFGHLIAVSGFATANLMPYLEPLFKK